MSQTSRAEHFFYNSINCVNEVLFLFVSSSRANSRCRGVRVLNIFNVSLVFFLSFDFHGFFSCLQFRLKTLQLTELTCLPAPIIIQYQLDTSNLFLSNLIVKRVLVYIWGVFSSKIQYFLYKEGFDKKKPPFRVIREMVNY